MTKKKTAAEKSKTKAKSKSKSKTSDGVVTDTGGKAIPMIAASALNTLMTQVTKFQNALSTVAGDIGDLIRDYADKKNLHKGAFADIKKLHRMGKKDPGKLWLHLAHFDDMRVKLKLDEIAQAQGQLVASGAEGEGEGEGDDDTTDTTVRTGDRVREVAEGAGAKLN